LLAQIKKEAIMSNQFENTLFFKVYNSPFSPGTSTEDILEFQNRCIDKNIFGMGWSDVLEKIKIKPNTEIHEKSSEGVEYGQVLKELKNERGFTTATNRYVEMREGSIIITRNKNSQVYIGRLCSDILIPDAKISDEFDHRFTWIGKVDKWHPLGTFVEIHPSIRGELSKRYGNTASRICNDSLKRTLWNIYAEYDSAYLPHRIQVDSENVHIVLDPDSLEDAVAYYIVSQDEYRNYFLVPSSCKKSTHGVEFILVNPQDAHEKVTCQVKSLSAINLSAYDKNYEHFKTIFFFSGEGYHGNIPPNGVIIHPKELCDVIKTNPYFTNILGKYHTFI
jgi:hypothetical protein